MAIIQEVADEILWALECTLSALSWSTNPEIGRNAAYQ